MTITVPADHVEPLFLVVQVESVENRGIVGGENHLLARPFGQLGEMAHEFGAELGVEGIVDVVDGKEAGCRLAEKQGEVE